MAPFEKDDQEKFSKIVAQKESQKLKSQTEKKRSEWFGLGVFGMVGWSVVVPTFLATLAGIWLDKNYPQGFSWTLPCLIIGLVIGCLIAWNWINKDHIIDK